MAKRKQWSELSKNEKIGGLVGLAVIVIVVIAIAAGGSKSTSSSTNQPASASKPASTGPSSGKASFEAVLWNPANDNNTSMTLPAAGWDANDGWDTAAQANSDSSSATAIQPAVIAKDAKTLELYINVKNTGKAAGTATCKVEASSVIGNPTSGQYFGANTKTFTALDGGNIKPGNYGESTDDLTITNQGARYIKQVTIQC